MAEGRLAYQKNTFKWLCAFSSKNRRESAARRNSIAKQVPPPSNLQSQGHGKPQNGKDHAGWGKENGCRAFGRSSLQSRQGWPGPDW